MKYNSFDKDRLRELPIRDVAERLGIQIPRYGNAHCFNTAFHTNGDRKPSLGFYRDDNEGIEKFKCFACGIGGDAIDLVAEYKGLDPKSKEGFREACEWLSATFGINGTSGSNGCVERAQAPRTYSLPELRIDDTCNYAKHNFTDIYQFFFDHCDEPNDDVKNWWVGRGLSLELLKKAKIKSVTTATWQALKENYSVEEALEAGLVKEVDGKYRLQFPSDYDMLFPFLNGDGTVLGFKLRSLKRSVPKYLAPQGFKLPVFRADMLAEWLRDTNEDAPIYISESETDAFATQEYIHSPHSKPKGIGSSVALCGAHKSAHSLDLRELVSIVSKKANPLVRIVTDNDESGKGFFKTVATELYIAGVNEHRIEMFQPHVEKGLKDMGDYVKDLMANT